MARHFVFFYTMREGAPEIRDAVPAHVAHWRRPGLEGYRGGPFADRSGGLITFQAADAREASALVESDPFVLRGLLRDRSLKEWLPE